MALSALISPTSNLFYPNLVISSDLGKSFRQHKPNRALGIKTKSTTPKHQSAGQEVTDGTLLKRDQPKTEDKFPDSENN